MPGLPGTRGSSTYLNVDVDDFPQQKQQNVHHLLGIDGHVGSFLSRHVFLAFGTTWIGNDDATPLGRNERINVVGCC